MFGFVYRLGWVRVLFGFCFVWLGLDLDLIGFGYVTLPYVMLHYIGFSLVWFG